MSGIGSLDCDRSLMGLKDDFEAVPRAEQKAIKK